MLMVLFLGFSFAEESATKNTNINLTLTHENDYDIVGMVEGVSTGWKFVPIIPFWPSSPAVLQNPASEHNAVENALQSTGSDLIMDKEVEIVRDGYLFVFWVEKIYVKGIGAKIKPTI